MTVDTSVRHHGAGHASPHSGVKKTVRLTLGQPYLDCIYRVGANTQYVQSGWSPDLVDLLYNAEMDRIWAPDVSYMGRRNPNTGATGAWVLGGGGAQFQKEIGGTLMKADEIRGTQKFEVLLYAGPTSAPDGSGHTSPSCRRWPPRSATGCRPRR